MWVTTRLITTRDFSDRSPLHDVKEPAGVRSQIEASKTVSLDEFFSGDPAGGARRDRTDDLLLAKQALSQLSYGPISQRGLPIKAATAAKVGGPGKI
jgi:hypothetical protein